MEKRPGACKFSRLGPTQNMKHNQNGVRRPEHSLKCATSRVVDIFLMHSEHRFIHTERLSGKCFNVKWKENLHLREILKIN